MCVWHLLFQTLMQVVIWVIQIFRATTLQANGELTVMQYKHKWLDHNVKLIFNSS